MKKILHMAISADGYVAKENGDSDWVSDIDEKLFQQRVANAGCVILGRKTFDQYEGKIYPVEKAMNIVLSRKPRVHEKGGLVRWVQSPQEAVALAKEARVAEVVIAGGGEVSGAFLKEGLLDDIYLTVHPFILGGGIRLFEGAGMAKELRLMGSKILGEDLVELHYKAIPELK